MQEKACDIEDGLWTHFAKRYTGVAWNGGALCFPKTLQQLVCRDGSKACCTWPLAWHLLGFYEYAQFLLP